MAEKILWERLRLSKTGFKFFRQYSVDAFVIDFYCPTQKLAVEIEGSIHNKANIINYDKFRYQYLGAFGIKLK